jgi:type IV secretion system protein TrbL
MGMSSAIATIPPALDTFGQVLGNYQTAATTASSALTPYAQHLLMALFAIELIWTACLWSLSARSGYEILEQLCRRGMVIGLIYWLITNAVTILLDLFNGFQQLGAQALGVTNLSPSGVLQLGLNMSGTVLEGYIHSSLWVSALKGNIGATVLLPLIASLIILVAFTVAAVWYLMTSIEMYLVIGGGAILMALGGAEMTGAIFQRFLSRAIGLGMRLMFIILTLAVGMQLANNWLIVTQTTPDITVSMLLYLIANSFMFGITVLGVPYLASSLANDSVSFGLAQAFEATWLAGTIARGVQRGLSAAKHVATLNASRARVAKASTARQTVAQMPGVQPNYPPPPPPPTKGNIGPQIDGSSYGGGSGGTLAISGPDTGANGRKDHKTLDFDQWKKL